MDIGLSSKTARRCLARSGMLNCAYSTRGLQSMGFLYSVLPGLRELHKDDESFAQSCARYSGHFNCHPIWAPFLCGAFLHAERQIAEGKISPDLVEMFKETTLNSLSAVGDSFISGSLVASLMLTLSCLVVLLNPYAVLGFLLIWLVLDIFLKLATFYLGLARGFSLLMHIRRLNLINKSDYLKIFNGILLVAFLALALGFPPDTQTELPRIVKIWFLPIGIMMALSYTVARIHMSRTIAVTVIIIGTNLLI